MRMSASKGNTLIIIENGQISIVRLDDRTEWTIGRENPQNMPDIILHTPTVSRNHGYFMNRSGHWVYYDKYGKNGTVYNKEHLKPGIGGKAKFRMLEDGDVFIFGGLDEKALPSKTVWAIFSEYFYGDKWSSVDTKDLGIITLSDGKSTRKMEWPQIGDVLRMDDGIAIYMGDTTYLAGEIRLIR